jgi:3-hydroxybutyryl-CoA dehydrogenase
MKIFGIAGAGLMGADIAQIAAESGFSVILYDIDGERLKTGFENIKKRLSRYVREGRIDQNRMNEIVSKIKLQDNIKELENADFVLESIIEDISAKKKIFQELDRICKGGVVIASNTSSISITAIASATKRPELVIGMNFMNPARAIKLVELVSGFSTTRETVEMAKQISKKLGMTAVESKDYPGFLINRILMPMINEAIYALYEGAGTIEGIDKVIKQGLNWRMGPLELSDMIGLDVVLAVMEELYDGFSDSKYRPCPLLKNYVTAGCLGRKTGRGFYHYSDEVI